MSRAGGIFSVLFEAGELEKNLLFLLTIVTVKFLLNAALLKLFVCYQYNQSF